MKRYLYIFLIVPFLLLAEKYSVDLKGFGRIVYHLENELCTKIVRLSSLDEVRYEHLYHYDSNDKLISESLIGGLGEIVYSGSMEEGYLLTNTPFGEEKWSSEDKSTFEESNLERVYDSEGRLTKKGTSYFFYEGENLVEILGPEHTVFYEYNKDGKKVSKKAVFADRQEQEFYLYLGDQEIGSISDQGNLKWLRIPGMTTHKDLVRVIAIETDAAVYAPIYDHQWNIVKLINIGDGAIIETRPDPFGENLAELFGCPWTFSSKRFDSDTNLVDFGYRYYDKDLKEWTSLDPLMQDSNPYRYCFNNPLQFLDPDGRAGFLVPILTWSGGALTFPLWGPEALAILVGAGTVYLGCEIYEYWQDNSNKKMDQANQSEQDRKKAGELQKQVEKGQAPDSINRVDKGLGPYEKDHVHFKDDHALNHDGTWKHGERSISNKEKKWLQDNGWNLAEA